MSATTLSECEIRIVAAFTDAPDVWWTNRQLAHVAHVAERTARHHTNRLADMRVVDVEHVAPSPRFRLVADQSSATIRYLGRVAAAVAVLGSRVPS